MAQPPEPKQNEPLFHITMFGNFVITLISHITEKLLTETYGILGSASFWKYIFKEIVHVSIFPRISSKIFLLYLTPPSTIFQLYHGDKI